jgi:hypothetical protein
MGSLDINHYVRVATKQHMREITQIYRLVQIKPELFLEIANFSDDQAIPLQLIKTLGGFISPPDEQDMKLTLHNGLILVFVRDEKVVGYNRVITQADKVHHIFCAELQIDKSLREFSHGSFSNWSGNRTKQPGKILTNIQWIDRQQASLALKASIAGIENKPSGRLALSVDAAVHPANRKLGISRALINRLNDELKPEFQFRVFRIFEILAINDTAISIENTRSKKTFIDSSARQFAYTEEEVVINRSVTVRVRWNYWLRHF